MRNGFRVGFLGWLAVAPCLAAMAASGADVPDTEEKRLNVILVLADDLGWSDLACYGSELHQTPHIDRLARQGVRFTSAYAAAPVCSPTRASIMTGKCPARLHMTVWYEASQNPPRDRKLIPPRTVGDLAHEHVTIAELFHAAGYFTAHIGKWHLGDAAHYPETHGFDSNIGGTFWGAPSTFFHPYRGRWSSGTEYRYVPGLAWGSDGEYLTDRLTDEALATIRRVKDQPFFLYMAYHTVHTPIEGKPELVERYRGRLTAGQQHQNPSYAAMVHSLDENVGRLLSTLDELKIADQTVVLFSSDNGGYINRYDGLQVTDNRPLRSGKGTLYEGGIRVPLIVRWPGVTPAGATCDRAIVSTDFYPTLREVLGSTGAAERSIPADGTSLLPLLREPQGSLPRGPLFWHYPHYYFYPGATPVSAVRDGDWKLVELLEDNRVELYHLGDDLGESRDLAPSMPDKARQLRRMLHEWRESVDAQMPSANPEPTP